jgi:hypothetical protein
MLSQAVAKLRLLFRASRLHRSNTRIKSLRSGCLSPRWDATTKLQTVLSRRRQSKFKSKIILT